MEAKEAGLRILTWNINGLRSFEDFAQTIRSLAADILCFQETKVTRDMLPEPLAIIPGYTSYYTFTRNSTAYSGVATYVRNSCTPIAAEDGITGYLSKTESTIGGTDLINQEFTQEEMKSLDAEGRCVITKHKINNSNTCLVLINVYCPRADPEREDRKSFKLQFYKALDIRANNLAEEGHCVIVLGDINTSHRELDHCDPYDEFPDHPGRRFLTHFLTQPHHKDADASQQSSQKSLQNKDMVDKDFDDQEENLDGWECEHVSIKSHQFHDAFRIFHREREHAFTCWNTKMNCRSTNYGTRIDYIFVSDNFKEKLSSCDIHPDILGSDHCPVSGRLDLNLEPALKPPPSCTKFYPEFQGRQLNIKDMFKTAVAAKNNSTTTTVTTQKRPHNNLTTAKDALQPNKKQKGANSGAKITAFFAPKKTQDVNINIECSVKENQILKNTNEELLMVEKTTISETVASVKKVSEGNKEAWSKLFKPPKPNPLCSGHQEECVKRRVTKKGANQGREFFCCARGEGRADDPQARCNFFKWAK
eukprot:TRINITY_DN853_c0_g1_i3.p1 TRINITY_DN853_c0_g1~~TRINITY_DN853_c0_g1_i3.p1  ORF type:complete len:534 (-),score=82.79 TRINITY_DN853_c0_g1_i3:10-1611(-)